MTKEERQKKQSAGCWLVICHSGFLRHSAFLLHRFRSGSLLSPGVEIPNRTSYNENMLHLIWYLFVGFLVGCVAKALMHMHLSITWTVVLGIVGSIIGGAVTHLFYPPSAGGKFHLGGFIFSIAVAVLHFHNLYKLKSLFHRL